MADDARAPERPGDRSGAPTYNDILDQDSRTVPKYLREDCVPDIDARSVPAKNYTDPEFFQQEVDRVWSSCWQMVCREEDIPNVGDFIVFNQAHRSYLIVRSGPNDFKALLNVCLHRGRQLATCAGSAKKFRCMFHGLEWNIDGSFKHNPIEWDFPQWKDQDLTLPQAQVDRWAGFVFVNFDPKAAPLDSVIHPHPEHFERYRLDDMYNMDHV
ncbi:MAG: Rieske (2Fe-2S) protein, partial [Pseudomonadota bacterium]